MYVSHDHKFLFVHIPKTGGTALLKMYPGLIRHGKKHDSLADLKNPDRYRDYFIFAVVRNPYRRYVSYYRWRKHYSDRSLDRNNPEALQSLKSFSCFIKWMVKYHAVFSQFNYINHPFLATTVYKYEETDLSTILPGARAVPKNEKVYYLGDYEWTDYIDEEGIALINRYCAEDFKRFNYPLL